MNEEKRNTVNQEEENQGERNKVQKKLRRRRMLGLMVICAMMMSMSAAAEGETGLSAVLAQSTNATSIIGFVFDLITGNAYLALLCFFGLLGAGVRLFRKGKRAAR